MKTFVTLGFEQHPFDRLLKAVDEGIAREAIPEGTLVQRGHSPYVLRRCASVSFLSYAEMRAALQSAEIVIAQKYMNASEIPVSAIAPASMIGQ